LLEVPSTIYYKIHLGLGLICINKVSTRLPF